MPHWVPPRKVCLGHVTTSAWQTARPAASFDLLAPDGSQIRLLVSAERGSMVHCALPPGQITRAVRHRTVDEVWFCLTGAGQLWRRASQEEEVVDLEPGTAISLPVGTEFQFRATGQQPLEVVITTMPPWPGEDEAVPVTGPWEPTGK